MLRDYSLLCDAQGSISGESDQTSSSVEASARLAVLSLWPLQSFLFSSSKTE